MNEYLNASRYLYVVVREFECKLNEPIWNYNNKMKLNLFRLLIFMVNKHKAKAISYLNRCQHKILSNSTESRNVEKENLKI